MIMLCKDGRFYCALHNAWNIMKRVFCGIFKGNFISSFSKCSILVIIGLCLFVLVFIENQVLCIKTTSGVMWKEEQDFAKVTFARV